MSNIIYPDYNNCILNTVSSILKYYNVSCNYPTSNILDNALAKAYKNIVFMIFDGMGADALRKNLAENSFLRSNLCSEITSVYPCTTTAAMTSYYSGLSPNEHGWLGWSLYFKEYGRIIDTFTNEDSFTKEKVGDKHAAQTLMPYERIYDKIHNSTDGKVKIYTLTPSSIVFPDRPNIDLKVDSSEQICKNIEALCKENRNKFIMSYWPEPDVTMHSYGCYAEQTKAQIEMINRQVEAICKGLDDTLVIVTADHGLINVDEEIFINSIPEIDECLIMPPSIESRAVSFFIKPEMKYTFEKRFEKMFGHCYRLLKKEEVIKDNLFGFGIQHKKVDDFTGDYLACATGSVMLRYKTLISVTKPQHNGQHAGLRYEEMMVPLIII